MQYRQVCTDIDLKVSRSLLVFQHSVVSNQMGNCSHNMISVNSTANLNESAYVCRDNIFVDVI